MTNASVKGIIQPQDYENEPRRMKWKDLRRYWRRVHGFILPEKAEPCVMVEFYRGLQKFIFKKYLFFKDDHFNTHSQLYSMKSQKHDQSTRQNNATQSATLSFKL